MNLKKKYALEMEKCEDIAVVYMDGNQSIHVIYNRPQNPSKSADTSEDAMLAQGVC